MSLSIGKALKSLGMGLISAQVPLLLHPYAAGSPHRHQNRPCVHRLFPLPFYLQYCIKLAKVKRRHYSFSLTYLSISTLWYAPSMRSRLHWINLQKTIKSGGIQHRKTSVPAVQSERSFLCFWESPLPSFTYPLIFVSPLEYTFQ